MVAVDSALESGLCSLNVSSLYEAGADIVSGKWGRIGVAAVRGSPVGGQGAVDVVLKFEELPDSVICHWGDVRVAAPGRSPEGFQGSFHILLEEHAPR